MKARQQLSSGVLESWLTYADLLRAESDMATNKRKNDRKEVKATPDSGAERQRRPAQGSVPQDNAEARPNDPDFMTSLARGLAVMQAFTRDNPRMTSSQISVQTGLSRAAVRRCLYTLRQLGFVDIEDSNHFSLSHRVLTLSHAYTSRASCRARHSLFLRSSVAFSTSRALLQPLWTGSCSMSLALMCRAL